MRLNDLLKLYVECDITRILKSHRAYPCGPVIYKVSTECAPFSSPVAKMKGYCLLKTWLILESKTKI